MSIQISNDGAERLLKYMVGINATTETLFLRLYSNNVTPTSLTTLTDLVQVTGGGYQQKTLTVSDWNVDGNVATSDPQLFTFNANIGNIYGYYLVGQTSGELIASERFVSGPFNVANQGDTITVTATISVA